MEKMDMTSGRQTVSKRDRAEVLNACLWGVFLSGILLGAGGGGEELSLLAEEFLRLRISGGWKDAFLSSLASSFGMMAAIFVSGLCAVGQPAVVLMLLMRGMGVGGCVGAFYRQLGAGGAAAAVLLLVLPEAAAAFCFLQGSRSALKMSGRLFRAMVSREPLTLLPRVKRYAVKFVLLFLFLFMSAAVSGLCAGLTGMFTG